MRSFYEFFAGGGMARAGLGPGWTCLFANDFDLKKGSIYRRNWGGDALRTADIRTLTKEDLPGRPDLVWASFPCQDLSLAGGGAGLRGDRSGTFWPFWHLMEMLIADGRAPDIIVLENVCGTLTSHGGKDFTAICMSFVNSGYRFGTLVVDAARFLPHSRPRLFVVGVRTERVIPDDIVCGAPSYEWHPKALRTAFMMLPEKAQELFVWWSLPVPPCRDTVFSDLIEDEPSSVKWHTSTETNRLLAMMSPLNLAKVESAKMAGHRVVGAVYKRTRRDENSEKVQRAEIRFDGMAGCLRTPAGGSSRQVIVVIDGNSVRSRLLSTREAARLMGLPDTYELPSNYNEAYHLAGDGVAVPVVRYLAEHLIEPLLVAQEAISQAVA